MDSVQNILETIGNTPIVKINKLNPNKNTTIYGKVEGFNPTGSIKDRIALSMVRQAELEGKLTPGKTIIEPTSGNTGVALAMIACVKGYGVEIVMSEAVSAERIQMVKAFGGKVTLTDGKLGTDGAIKKARELVKEYPDKYFMPDQFSNKYNHIAHYTTTGEEIWKQTGGDIDYFVSAVGTSGTLMGVAKVSKPTTRISPLSAPTRSRPLYPGVEKHGRGDSAGNLRPFDDRHPDNGRDRRRL